MRARRIHPGSRAGFTIVELILAGVIAALVLGVLTTSMSQIVKSKSISKERLDAFVRADVALKNLRRDMVSILRRDDLFYTRLRILDDSIQTPRGEFNRDEILLFNHRLRASRKIEYNGEGVEYETAYRIDEDDWGPVLWQRRDALPDQYPTAGGIVTPIAEGIVELSIEAWDGEQWLEDWDSDYDGLPHALRISVRASGHLPGKSPWDAPIATLRTIVPLDRVPPPDDVMEDELQQLIALINGEEEGDTGGVGLSADGTEESEESEGAINNDAGESSDAPPDIDVLLNELGTERPD